MIPQTRCVPVNIGREKCRRLAIIGMMLLNAGGCQSTDCCDDGIGRKIFPWDCAHDDPCAEIPDGAIPSPVGTAAESWRCAQAEAAEQDKLVIYNYEFLCDTAELSPFGRQHVENISRLTETMAAPVIVQPSGDPQLDQARRTAVREGLASLGVVDPDARVIISRAKAEGLYGIEARQVELGFFGDGRGRSGSGNVRGGLGSGNVSGELGGGGVRGELGGGGF